MIPDPATIRNQDTGTQTDPLKVFCLPRFPATVSTLMSVGTGRENSPLNGAIFIDIEDQIIDSLMSKIDIDDEERIPVSWLKPPFAKKNSFSVSGKKLCCMISSNFTKILQTSNNNPSLNYHMERFNLAMMDIVSNKDTYFSRFGKLKFDKPLSLTQIFALFIVWMSEILRDDIAAFVVDYTTVLFLCLYSSHHAQDVTRHFVNKYVLLSTFPDIPQAENMCLALFGNSFSFKIEPNELVGYLSEYVKNSSGLCQ